MDRLLICGMPATGKTTIGEHLAKHHGYKNIDMERWPYTSSLIDLLMENSSPPMAETLLKSRFGDASKIVLTWGFPPGQHCFNLLQFLIETFSFKTVWFYGGLEKCCEAWLKRDGRQNDDPFNLQMQRIGAAWPDLQSFFPSTMLTVRKDGSRPPVEEIAAQLIRV